MHGRVDRSQLDSNIPSSNSNASLTASLPTLSRVRRFISRHNLWFSLLDFRSSFANRRTHFANIIYELIYILNSHYGFLFLLPDLFQFQFQSNSHDA
jgi:hypothetical protein